VNQRRRHAITALAVDGPADSQQVLAIGRALMARPRVLLLDEPSMGLAPMVISQIFKIISEINSQGTPVLLVEQNAQQALTRSIGRTSSRPVR
jgi:ABC-type branched-subunit amino acid transport system ATPase component